MRTFMHAVKVYGRPANKTCIKMQTYFGHAKITIVFKLRKVYSLYSDFLAAA